MKRLLICLLLVGVLGCGKDEYDPSMDDQPPGSPAHGSPFIVAVAKGDIEAVKKHLADGADVNVDNPLNHAIESQAASRKEIVEFLLAKGADVNAKNNRGWTPAESLKRTKGAMIIFGETPEQEADNIEIARLLLQHGAQTDADFKHLFPDATSEPTPEPETPDPTPPEDPGEPEGDPRRRPTASQTIFPVTGTITYDGKPLTGARIRLQPGAGEPPLLCFCDSKADGTFEFERFFSGDVQKGAPVGIYKVLVAKFGKDTAGADNHDPDADEAAELELIEALTEGGPDVVKEAPVKNQLHKVFGNTSTTPLKLEVKEGKNSFRIDLKSDGTGTVKAL